MANALSVELKRLFDQDRAMEQANPNMVCFSLVQDLEHWHSYDIYTVDELWAYLDAC